MQRHQSGSIRSERLGKHLGLKVEEDRLEDGAMVNLDRRLAQHTRYLYKVQEAASGGGGSEESDEDRYCNDSDDEDSLSTYRRSGRKRMSIMTNWYLDVADAMVTTSGKIQNVPRRRFFKT